jgi:hypothetical protein
LVLLSGKVVEASGEGVSSVGVQLTRANGVIGYDITDANGNFGGLVPANEAFTINISKDCIGSFYTNQIGPFSENTTLAPITINLPGSGISTLSGTVVDCNGQPLAYSTIVMEPLSGATSPVIGFSDSEGAYSIHFVKCESAIAVNITAYDGAQAFQSAPQTVEIVNNPTTVGEIAVCTTLDEYLQMNIDGNIHIFTINVVFDTSSFDNQIYGNMFGGNGDSTKVEIGFSNLTNNQASVNMIWGTYADPALPLPVNFGCFYCPACNCTPTNAEPIHFTNVPTAPGEYAIGSAVGNVLVGNVLKPYSISFRIKQ